MYFVYSIYAIRRQVQKLESFLDFSEGFFGNLLFGPRQNISKFHRCDEIMLCFLCLIFGSLEIRNVSTHFEISITSGNWQLCFKFWSQA